MQQQHQTTSYHCDERPPPCRALIVDKADDSIIVVVVIIILVQFEIILFQIPRNGSYKLSGIHTKNNRKFFRPGQKKLRIAGLKRY